jgi:hypothetical protein
MPPFCSFRDMPKMRFGCLTEASFPVMRTFPRKNKILAVNPYPFTLAQQHKFSSKISVLRVVKYLHYPDGVMDQISRTEIEASTIYKGKSRKTKGIPCETIYHHLKSFHAPRFAMLRQIRFSTECIRLE